MSHWHRKIISSELLSEREALARANARIVELESQLTAMHVAYAKYSKNSVAENRELRDQVKMLRQLTETLNVVFWVRDYRTRCIDYINPAYERVWGRSAQSLFDRPESFSESIHPDDRAAVGRAVQKQYDEGSPFIMDYRIIRPDGSVRWVSGRSFFIYNEHGEPQRIVGFMEDITERKYHELSLQESRMRYRTLVEELGGTQICRWLPDTTLTFVNKAYAAAYGKEPEELIGTKWIELVPEQERTAVLQAYQQLMQTLRTFRYEHTVQTADGAVKNILWTDSPLVDKDRSLTEFQSVGVDITERKRIEDALRESESRYRAIFDNATVGIFQTVPDGTSGKVNPALARIFGYDSAEEMQRMVTNIAEQLYQDPAERVRIIAELIEKGALVDREVKLRRKDGSPVWLSVNVTLAKDPKGFIQSFEGTVIDISTRKFMEIGKKIMEDALRESEEKFRVIVESAHDAVVLIDTQGKVQVWNKAAEGIFGYTLAEVRGKDLHQLLAPERFLSAYSQAFPVFTQTGQGDAIGKTLELAARCKDGREIMIGLSLSSVRTMDGWTAIGIIRDITEQKRIEAELNAAKEAAEAADRAKSLFLANMSHEIRNPMNGLLGLLGLLAETALDPKQKELVHYARTAGNNLQYIANEILELARIEQGGLQFEEKDFAFHEIFDALQIHRQVAESKGLAFSIARTSKTFPKMLRGDLGRLLQVLNNLIGNAIKFTKQGSVCVSVKQEDGGPEEVRLRFSVIDTGIGIAQKDQHLLFQPFSQVDSSYTKKFQGAGLGLSIVKKIIEHMGGTISLLSAPNEGSTFSFTVTMHSPHEEHEGSRAGADIRTMEWPQKPLRILLVEDDLINRYTMKLGLERNGYIITEARDGVEAVEAVHRALFDLILMDGQMENMNGLDATQEIRALGIEVPIIGVTGYAMENEKDKFIGAGMNTVVTKPVQDHELLKAFIQVLPQE